MDPEKFERQMEYMLANQTRHDDQIQGLIRVGELQQANLERLEAGLDEFKTDVAASIRELRESRKAADEQENQLVSAIGEWIRQSSARN